MKVLVTGGKGYIGAITAQALTDQGYEPVIFDLKDGNDIRDQASLVKTLAENKIEAVIHFAAFIEMGESMRNPYKYFDNNVGGSLKLLQAMSEANVNKLIFSSSAGVYGNPQRVPIKEDDPKKPTNPYGESKLMVEKMLAWYDQIFKLRSISIRYFNAAGASLDGSLGESHEPESHLIPNLLAAVAADREFSLFGNDYPTADGTCVRDYIHVVDLSQAHVLALKALLDDHKTDSYNAGTGEGYSNKQVIAMVEKVTGKKVKVKLEPRRPGDAAELVADSSKLQTEFAWKPQHSDLETIIKTAWQWHKRLLQ